MAALRPPSEKVLKAKVCLVGEFAVGKTSLVNRYVHNVFEDRYFVTIGAKITKTELTSVGKDRHRVTMTVWDIMGEKGFRELLREAYFEGTQGIVAVSDLTRPETLEELEGWISSVYRIAGKVPLVVVGNKADLEDDIQVRLEDVARFARKHSCSHVITSAKTGENVELAFKSIAKGLLKNSS